MTIVQSEETSRRRRALWPTGFRIHPPIVTTLIISAIVATAWRTGVFHHDLSLTMEYQYGYSGRQIQAGHWSTLFTNQLLTRNTFMCLSICLSVAVFVGIYEALAGSLRAIVVIVVCGIVGPLGVEAGLGLGNVLGSTWAANTLSTLDFGASAITAGGAGAVVALLRWRWLRVVALLIVLSGLPLHHQLADWEHLISFTFGFGLGLILGPRPEVGLHPEQGDSRRAARLTPLAWVLLVPAAVLGVLGSTTFISSAASGSSSAQVIEATYPSAALHSSRRVLVVLPPGYGQSSQRYPVVEMLHGVPGGLEEVIGGLNVAQLSNQSKTPFIAVAPDGTGPAVGESDFANTSRQPMGTVTGPELRQWVDSHYPTNGTWEVTGLSSGGYGAAYLPTLSPGVYQQACPMSGFFTAEPPAFEGQSAAVKQAGSPILHVSARGPRTLLVAGSSDPGSLDQARRYIAAMNGVGEPNNGLITNPGGHELPVWTTGIKQCLGFFFPASGLHG
ncbi:MAG TPA: alpha/beta hydrolase-fold protein [Acidimicrobiales bacterium]|nr:alpha/beta hydrolase-fold protein [Acidimicrobiales bacterium]